MPVIRLRLQKHMMHGLLCCSLSLPLRSPVLLHADNRNVQNIHMCPLEFPETVFRYSADAANSIPYAES